MGGLNSMLEVVGLNSVFVNCGEVVFHEAQVHVKQ